MSEYDLIIRGGNVIDGTGSPARQCDVAVKDGRIAAIEAEIAGSAAREIDATGQIVTPGFIDVHTHYDGQATWDAHLNPSSNLGTTTVVMGNCGVGFAPCKPEDHDVLIELMEGVEEIPGTAMAEGLPWNWESFSDYLDALDAKPRDIDIAALSPHGPVRVYVMGERGLNREPATSEDIDKMRQLVREGIEAGAVGFSTSRTLVHRTSRGESVPTYKAATDELKALGEALSGESGNVFQMISDWDDADDEFSILRHTAEKTGAKGTFTLLQLDNRPTEWQEQLERIERAQAEDLDIRGQVLSRPVGMLMGHPASMSIFSPRPTYRKLLEQTESFDEFIAELKKPETKEQILSEEMENPHIFAKIFSHSFGRMYPLAEPIDYLPSPETSVKAQAEQAGQDAESWLYDYFLEDNGRSLVYIPAANFNECIPELLGHDFTVPALGDGGAHVGTICDASANLYVLTKWVKERRAFELEQAIHMLTQKPAELYSMHDRGTLAVGMKADINVIDYDKLALKTPHIVHDLPAGGKRLLQNAEGLSATVVSGEVIYQNGDPTGALPGKLIRGRQSRPAAAA
ncbi:MAG: amidohydrolase family protein [Gammaproteobacteria bacterium]|nr:amidohydrolase family protein [Gammaproteobacteria bacterium]